MIPDKMLNANKLLRPSFSPQDTRGDLQTAYKQWFIMAMISVNFYVELLIKQLNRKGRSHFEGNPTHPLYQNTALWTGADIKSGSVAPYERNSPHNLGLNQFFVGQNPKEWYQGDIGDDNGIYHDTSRIVTTKNQGLMRKPQFTNEFYVPEQSSDNSYFPAYTKRQSLSLELGVNVACSDEMYIKYKDRFKLYLCEEVDKDYSLLYQPEIKDYKIVKKAFIYPQREYPKSSSFFPTEKDRLNYLNQIKAYWEDFTKLNGTNIKIFAPLGYQNVAQYPTKDEGGGQSPLKYASFQVSLKAVLDDYTKCFPNYLHPMYFEKHTTKLIFTEPIYCHSCLYTEGLDGNNDKEITAGSFSYLYNHKSGGVYGRRDKWLYLWPKFYTLYVKEDKGTGGFVGFIFNVAVFVISVVVAYYTGLYVGEALSAALGSAISGTTALGIQVAIMGVSLGAGLMVGLGTITGSAFFANLGSAILGIVGLVGAGANLVTAATTAASQGMQVSTLQVATSAVNTLSSAVNVINGINTFMQTMDKGQELINENEDEDSFFNGKSDEEIAKDFLEPSIWYDLNTADLLGA